MYLFKGYLEHTLLKNLTMIAEDEILKKKTVFAGNWTETVYCQILSNDGHVRIIKSTVDTIWYDKWDTNDNNTYFNPVLLSCR